MLVLLLIVALLAIGAAAVAPSIAFQIKRDREEEMIHRGVQYSRAIRHFVKKFGRYPTRLEELDSTNNLRFLRKRYKDPVTGQDFKLLHVGEVQMFPGASQVGTPVTDLNKKPAENNPSAGATGGSTDQDTSGSDSNKGGDTLSSQVFGGGPIVGVVSTSKAQTIREFNGKNHYNQWQFIYDPSSDRGGLLTTPAQPPLKGVAPVTTAPGSPMGGSNPQPQQPAPTQTAPEQ